MKFSVFFKTPNAVVTAIDTTHHHAGALNKNSLSAMEKVANKFVKFGEQVEIEFDTEEGTATVVPR